MSEEVQAREPVRVDKWGRYGNERLVRVLLIERAKNDYGRTYISNRWGTVDPDKAIFA